jgi:hypothetical protein
VPVLDQHQRLLIYIVMFSFNVLLTTIQIYAITAVHVDLHLQLHSPFVPHVAAWLVHAIEAKLYGEQPPRYCKEGNGSPWSG